MCVVYCLLIMHNNVTKDILSDIFLINMLLFINK